MIAAGLIARNAVAKGLKPKPWVKTSLAPGSQVVADYLKQAGLQDDLDRLGYELVGFGCATCIGNSGPLLPEISEAINANDLTVTAVLSGNRNFEGRISPDVKMNYLASPPLVIAYALAGTMDFDFEHEALGKDPEGNDVYLKDIWPTNAEVEQVVSGNVSREMFLNDYASVFEGDSRWKGLDVPEGELFAWNPESTYVRKQTFFDGMSATPAPVEDIRDARVLALLGDSVTTDGSLLRVRSRPRARRASISSNMASSRRTSTHTDRVVATMRSWCAAPSAISVCATCSSPRWERRSGPAVTPTISWR